jgi:hypothetical protein
VSRLPATAEARGKTLPPLRRKRLCPRCKSDVVAWEQESFPLIQFIRRGGLLGVLPSLAAIAIYLGFRVPKGRSVHHPLVTVVSIALSQMVLIVLYITRLSWREKRWAAQIYSTSHLSLPTVIIVSFVGAVVGGILSFILYKIWNEGEVPFWQQMVFGAVYAPAYVLLTRSRARMPPPLGVGRKGATGPVE